MPSAFILAARGYPAMPLARQLAHQRCVLSNPLVLGEKPLTFPAPTTDRDRPVSRRSKPSSRTAFIGEQPNPWELLHPQDAMSRHRMHFHHFWWHRLCLHPVVDFSDEYCIALTLSASEGMTASLAETCVIATALLSRRLRSGLVDSCMI